MTSKSNGKEQRFICTVAPSRDGKQSNLICHAEENSSPAAKVFSFKPVVQAGRNCRRKEKCENTKITTRDLGTTGLVLSKPGVYELCSNASYTPSKSDTAAITITASNVTLLLKEHVLSQGNAVSNTVGIHVIGTGITNIVVQGGTVENFTFPGMVVESPNFNDVSLVKVLNMSFINNSNTMTTSGGKYPGAGLFIRGSALIVVEDCDFLNHKGSGIRTIFSNQLTFQRIQISHVTALPDSIGIMAFGLVCWPFNNNQSEIWMNEIDVYDITGEIPWGIGCLGILDLPAILPPAPPRDSKGLLIENCQVRKLSGNNNPLGIILNGADNSVIRNCHVSDIEITSGSVADHPAGISPGGRNILVENCTVDNVFDGDSNIGDAVPFFIAGFNAETPSENVTFRNCVAKNIRSATSVATGFYVAKLDLYGSTFGNVVENCAAGACHGKDGQGYGFFFGNQNGAVVNGCKSLQNDVGMIFTNTIPTSGTSNPGVPFGVPPFSNPSSNGTVFDNLVANNSIAGIVDDTSEPAMYYVVGNIAGAFSKQIINIIDTTFIKVGDPITDTVGPNGIFAKPLNFIPVGTTAVKVSASTITLSNNTTYPGSGPSGFDLISFITNATPDGAYVYYHNTARTNGEPGDNYIGVPPSTPIREWSLPDLPNTTDNNGILDAQLDNIDIHN